METIKHNNKEYELVLEITIHKKNKYTTKFLDNEFITYYPRDLVLDMFTKSLQKTPAYLDNIQIPVIIYDNKTNKTTILNTKKKDFTADHIKYDKIPKSVKYYPNKLITIESDDWKLDATRRHFNAWNNGTITEQEYRSRMLNVLQ
tara:strand:+ start:1065 stop:1502 length:438 start_codon:yes stop_codon:yes gene_type:complete